jgi:hypothetical protein
MTHMSPGQKKALGTLVAFVLGGLAAVLPEPFKTPLAMAAPSILAALYVKRPGD